MADKKIFANQGPTKPSVPKSTYDLSHVNNLTAKLGLAIPCLLYDAPAGSSFRIRPYVAFDMQPMVFPIQTNVRCHLKFYKIPKRILWKHFKEFIGQHGPNGSLGNPYTMPYVGHSHQWFQTGSLADYMGIPTVTVNDVESTDVVTLGDCQRFVFYNSGKVSIVFPFLDPNVLAVYGHFFQIKSTANLGNLILKFRFRLGADQSLSNSLFTGKTLRLTQVESSEHVNRPYYYVDYLFRQFGDSLNHTRNVLNIPYNSLSFQNGIGSTHLSDLAKGKYTYLTDSVITVNGVRYVTIACNVPLSTDQSNTDLPYVSPQSSFYSFILSWASSAASVFGDFSGNGGSDVSNLTLGKEEGEESFSRAAFLDAPGFTQVSYDTLIAMSSFDVPTHFQSVGGAAPSLPINVLPFRAYEFIGNFFFRNERVTPFQKDGHDVFNEFITNDGDGADVTTPLTFFRVPYEYDLFTTCVKDPQFGNAPLVGITTNQAEDTAVFHMQNVSVKDENNQSATYSIGVRLNDQQEIVQITNYDDVADKPSVMRLQEAIQYGISINDFRNVNALQRFQERHLKAGTKYQNIVFEFFGTNPPIGEEFPSYLGGVTSNINVSKITNQAETSEMKLGDFAGQGSFSAKGNRIRCFCAEDSYIMGIVYFTATPVYGQKLDRLWTKSHLLDYYNPQFANLGPQPVYKHQLAPLQLANTGDVDNPADLFAVFGYNRPFSEYVSMQDEVHGDFRTTMHNYLMQRQFSGVPSLNEDFIYIDSEDMTDVFSVNLNTDKIFGQIYFDMKAQLPIPRFAVPRII